MTTDNVKEMFRSIRETLEDKLYNESMQKYNEYCAEHKVPRLPKVGKDAELYQKQCREADEICEACNTEYVAKLGDLLETLDKVSDELEHRLWFYMMGEINS